MKTIQELYNEVMNSEELKKECLDAIKAGQQEAFLQGHGCFATLDEVAAFLAEKSEEDAPLSLDELESSAGGGCNSKTTKEVFISIGLVGVGCVVKAIGSAAGGYVGQKRETDSRLCNH